ncbi:MAG: hypothetical protein KF729_32920 [Sandaracinaceae bacterium]|nr:hypothetical protein [Sandaracinaceae bacterium]
MSTPIKPPGATPGTSDAAGVEPTGEESGVERAGGSFRAALDDARAVGTPAASVGPLEAELRAGRITPEAAIERLVDRALASASGLPESRRAALEAQLRDALAADPTLIALRKDLERASSKA